MSTHLDERLRESLDAHVHAAVPPLPDVSDLVRRGRRRRNRRVVLTSALTVGAVAAVATIGIGLATGSGPSDGLRTQRAGIPIATGGATGPESVPGPTGLFVTRSRVYLDGTSYDVKLPWDTGAHVGKLGVAYPAPGTHRPTLLLRDGTVKTLAERPDFAGAVFDNWVAADGNGTLVAWAEHTDGAADIVAYDTATDRVVGRTTLRCHESDGPGGTYCPRPYVVSDGTVFISVYGGGRAWQPSDSVLGPLLDGDIAQAHHKVVSTFEDRGLVSLDRIGAGWAQAHSPKGVEGILSYDGGWILDNGGNPKVVNWRDPSQTITYRPPGKVAASVFDTDGSVLVVTRAGDPAAMDPDGETNTNLRWTGWDCPLEAACTVVVPEQKQEIRLVAWDL